MHGGSVTATSEGLGKGSEFIIRLPASVDALEKPHNEENLPKVVRAGARVLVVDDNIDTAEGLAKLPRLLGHEVQTAFDGPRAVELAPTKSGDYSA
jgi:hypothetical protein